MADPAATHRGRSRLFVIGIAALAVAVDQAAKTWAMRSLVNGPRQSGFGPRLVLTFNSGAAFSVGAGRSGLFTVLALVTMTVLAVYALRARLDPWRAIAFGLIIGGAAGNLVDRLARGNGGRVIDFIEAARWYPVFNVADALLFVGVAVLLVASWRRP